MMTFSNKQYLRRSALLSCTRNLLLAAFSIIALSACIGSDSDDPEPFTPPEPPNINAQIRIIHASPDAPAVDVLANGNSVGGLADLDYQTATGLAFIRTGSFEFTVEAQLPGGASASVITLPATLENDVQYNVLAIGEVANIAGLVVANPETAVGDGNIRAQVVHGAPNAPTVDIYVTAPDADIAVSQPLATLAFGEFTGQVEVPAGSYRIRVAAAGTTTVVFDSGTIEIAAGVDLFITATENVLGGEAPINLTVADGLGSGVIVDVNSQAQVRAIHGIADAPAVDVFADIEGDNDLLLFDAAPFKGVTDYISVPAGDYLLDVKADADNGIVAIDDAAVSLMANVRYTALANNSLANADLDLVVDDGRPLATAAQVRVFHASQATGPVDIYVTSDGEIDGVDPAFAGVAYSMDALAETGYVQLAAGDYVLTVTPTGTKTEAIETGVLTLEAAKIYTAFAVDGDMIGDAPQLILADDFVE
ncbi:DUF4397 domain-containing protein [Ningiella sp. W23]|uniref:DUF4397 domain-containing protein n=1 Tax=Ningiella sp. W23 TaxID=3023715 RepID=UPI003756BB3E